MKNEEFEVLKIEKGSFLVFKDFFIEERRIWSSKKQKKVLIDFLKTFVLKNERFEVLKKKKRVFLEFFF